MAETGNVPAPAALPDSDPVVAHLWSVNDERLRALAATMEARTNERNMDADDARLLRLLLEEYTGAVRQVRAAAQLIDRTLNAVGSTVREGRRAARAQSRDAGVASE